MRDLRLHMPFVPESKDLQKARSILSIREHTARSPLIYTHYSEKALSVDEITRTKAISAGLTVLESVKKSRFPDS